MPWYWDGMHSPRKINTDKVAQLLARATAGANHEPSPSRSVKGGNAALDVMAALGLSRANHWGVMILLTSYQEDPQAKKEALARSIRFVWNTWLTTAPPHDTVTISQVKRLAGLGLYHHCNPAKGRKLTQTQKASWIGVNHKTFKHKFKPHLDRLLAELSYEEQEAIRKLSRRI